MRYSNGCKDPSLGARVARRREFHTESHRPEHSWGCGGDGELSHVRPLGKFTRLEDKPRGGADVKVGASKPWVFGGSCQLS